MLQSVFLVKIKRYYNGIFCIFWISSKILPPKNFVKKIRRFVIQSNLVIRNILIRNKLVLRNHFSWPIANLLPKNKEHLTLRNNFRVTKKFLITKFDCKLKNGLCEIVTKSQVVTKLIVTKSKLHYTYMVEKFRTQREGLKSLNKKIWFKEGFCI